MATDEELANLQRLSNDYVPEVQVGLMKPDLRGKAGAEFTAREILLAKDNRREQSLPNMPKQTQSLFTRQQCVYGLRERDPVKVITDSVEWQALPRKYSHYRTLRGDGNCGWRALAFGYFEALIRTGDSARVQAEAVRLKSMNNLLSVLRQDAEIYEDFVQETLDLLERTRVDMNEDHGRNLLASFNDDGISAAVITHFRIDPYAVEIEHLGIQALFDAVIKPAGIAMEVLYLDRSAGEEVNTIRWSVDDHSGHYLSIPTIRLLYRPGHYDLLYKIEDLPEPPVPQPPVHITQVHMPPVHINNMFHSPHFASNNLLYSHGSFDLDTWNLPGMSTTGISSSGISSVGLHPAAFPPDIYQPSPFAQHAAPMSPGPYAVSPYPPPPPPMHSQTHESNSQGTFRASRFELEPAYQTLVNSHMEPCQTEAMKSAGESTSHFRNERFQPEIWEPGPEYNKSLRDTETPSS
ncbi:MAG: hypothetical protein Q9191_008310 [Dirinaria sp. TL-2023a]